MRRLQVLRQCFALRRVGTGGIRGAQHPSCAHHQRSFSSASLGSVLVVSNLYPQPSASAAGVRTNYLLQQLCRDSDWSSIHYATGAASNEDDNRAVSELTRQGVLFHSVPPNQSLKMLELLDRIENLSLVIFDRFYAEEAYSFHVYKHSPGAVRVVDMQDMHSLRQGRRTIVESNNDESACWDCMTEALQCTPSNKDDMLLRELASMHRSDLSLVCSPHEYKLLINAYNSPSSKLCMAPFWVSKQQQPRLKFDERRDFVFVGGFRHAPNVDAVQQLANHVWPRIRKRLPESQLHVYGAYFSPSIHKLHDPDDGFLIHGFVDRLDEALSDKRVMLAPLRYGAGIKGKIIDAWMFGIPVVTTSIGSEGIASVSNCNDSDEKWGGTVANTIDEFVDGAIRLYTNSDVWEQSMETADTILGTQFSELQFETVSEALKDAVRNQKARRHDDYFGPLLWHQTARSTEYFSRWIECKENKPR